MQKITKQNIPEGFTVSLAVIDCLPVLFFSIMVSVLSIRFHSLLFYTGAFFVIAAGFLKCLWKFVIAFVHKNIPFLFYQMRIVMPFGFLLMILGVLVNRTSLNWHGILQQILSFPSNICYLIGLIGMCSMIVFARRLDSTDKNHNWLEQTVNAIAQFFIMLGVLL